MPECSIKDNVSDAIDGAVQLIDMEVSRSRVGRRGIVANTCNRRCTLHMRVAALPS